MHRCLLVYPHFLLFCDGFEMSVTASTVFCLGVLSTRQTFASHVLMYLLIFYGRVGGDQLLMSALISFILFFFCFLSLSLLCYSHLHPKWSHVGQLCSCYKRFSLRFSQKWWGSCQKKTRLSSKSSKSRTPNLTSMLTRRSQF